MRSRQRVPIALTSAVLVALASACSTGSTPTSPTTRAAAGQSSTSPTSIPTSIPTSSVGSTSSTGSTSSAQTTASSTATTQTSSTPAQATTSASTPPTSPTSCSATLVEGLDANEQAGQLLMVGLDVNAGRSSLDPLVRTQHLGGVILLGGWYSGAASVRATTSHLASLATKAATGGLGLFLAADQEGGNVQQLRGAGFTRIATARVQDQLTPANLADASATWAGQLKNAGINVNLAPVADTVPLSIGKANQPIGRWDRQFSSNPDRVAEMVGGFIKGMHRGGVATTIKHFPGLGRITGNTDVTATGITDTVTTMTDPYLRPFAAGIKDGTDFVMVGSAIYSKIDPGTNAVFSRTIITDLLRRQLGFNGVVITDDVGAAKSVAAVPVGQRATRFIAAGGDIVLTAQPSTVPTMHAAITAKMAKDPAFAAQVRAAVTRVVELKVQRGLATCR